MIWYCVFVNNSMIAWPNDFLSARRYAAQYLRYHKKDVVHILRQKKYPGGKYDPKYETGHWIVQWLKYPDDRKRLYLSDEWDVKGNLRVLTDSGYYWSEKRKN